jgi:itaconyl-CoA hydratase
VNQDGVEVMSFEGTMLIYKRGHSPEEAVFTELGSDE